MNHLDRDDLARRLRRLHANLPAAQGALPAFAAEIERALSGLAEDTRESMRLARLIVEGVCVEIYSRATGQEPTDTLTIGKMLGDKRVSREIESPYFNFLWDLKNFGDEPSHVRQESGAVVPPPRVRLEHAVGVLERLWEVVLWHGQKTRGGAAPADPAGGAAAPPRTTPEWMRRLVSVPSARDRLAEYLDRLETRLNTRIESRKLFETSHFIPRRYRLVGSASSRDAGSIVLADELKGRQGFALFGVPGSGKSISFYLLAKELLASARDRLVSTEGPLDDRDGRTDGPAPSALVPVFVEARDVAKEVRDRLAADPSGDASDFVGDILREKLLRPYGPPEDVASPEGLRTLCAETGTRPVILFEGFDELVSPAGLSTPLTKLVVEQLGRFEAAYDLAFAISSRHKERDTLRPLWLKELELRTLDDGEVAEYVAHRWPDLPVSPCDVAATFREKLDSRPLYLTMLCEYFERAGPDARHPDNRVTLLRDCIDGVIKGNLSDLPWDDAEDSGHQRRCLRQLADELSQSSDCTESRIEEIVGAELGDDCPRDRFTTLVGCLKRFLVEDEKGFRFFHQVQRDYFLTDLLRLYLETGRGEVDRPLMLIHRVPEIMELLVLLIKDSPPRRLAECRTRLLDGLGPPSANPTPPEPRTRRDEPAAALALLIRLFPAEDRTDLDCSRRCFQGLAGADQYLGGINLAGSCLRGSDLRGANLDEADLREANLDDVDLRGASLVGADLRGAFLQNAQIGRLDPQWPRPFERDGEPTDMCGARLDGSDWFNVRVRHDGYFQLWITRTLPDSRHFLISTTRGELWFMGADGGEPVAIPTGHRNDILGFDYLEPERVPAGDIARERGWGWLATCSRDCSLRFFRCDPDAHPPRLDPPDGIELHRSTSDYFTRLKLGAGWLAVGDRAGHVYFISFEDLARLDDRGTDGTLAVEKHRSHTAPVVCLEGAAGPSGRDIFYTAGYDGRVCVHSELRGRQVRARSGGEERWISRELVNLNELHDGRDGTGSEPIIRAVVPWSPGPGHRGGLWLGDERGCLHFKDLDTKEIRLLDRRPGEQIFSAAVHPEGRELAVGLASGRVLLYDLVIEGGIRLVPRREILLACGDIIRSVLYLGGGDSLLIVSWAGLVHIWSRAEERFTLAFDPVDRYWRPEDDRRHLRLGSSEGVAKIRRLSPRYLRYLSLLGLPCAR